MSVRAAVIGGGPLGLMMLKNLKDEGFDATLYESRSWVGGLWKYSKDDSLSTAENTVFNSSKYRTAISDFPVPESMADFPPAEQLHEYLESYCDHFDLWPHIKLNSPVKTVRRQDDQWILEVGKETDSWSEAFDKVAVSCGSFIKPKQPDFKDIDKFQGKTLHAMNYHNPSQFKGKRVLVVGLHASAQDIVSSLSKYGSHVCLSHRSGVVMLPRYTNDGSVYDRIPPLWFTILTLYLGKYVPTFFNWMMDNLIQSVSRKEFPNIPDSWGFSPAPSISVSPPLIADELYPHLQSGFCEPVPEVARIAGPRSVELKSGRVLEEIDTIIYCTGYHLSVPVEIEPRELNPYAYPGAPPTLYHHTFPLHPSAAIRTSLAFLGQGAIAFPGFAPHEAIGLCVTQIWAGKSTLPPLAEMQRWHTSYLAWREDMTKRYNARSTFYTAFVPTTDHIAWVDATAGLGLRRHFGLVERWTNGAAWGFWWRERRLYRQCLNGITSPAIFRLFETGKRRAWKGAREQIFVDEERAVEQQKRRLKWLEKQKSG